MTGTSLQSWLGYKPSLADLRKAANQNLSRVLRGEIRQQDAALAESRRAKKESDRRWMQFRAQETEELRDLIRRQRDELADLDPWWEQLLEQHTAGTISAEDRGILEELDSRRDVLVESIGEATDRLAQLSS